MYNDKYIKHYKILKAVFQKESWRGDKITEKVA